MDAYIVEPMAHTCLGYGNELWDRLIQGESGLTEAQEIFPDWFPKSKSKIGGIKEISQNDSRLFQILEQIGRSSFTPQVEKCEIILGASSLGDLEGIYAGDPYGCMSNFFKTRYPKLADKFKGVISSACSSGTDVLSMAAALVDQQNYDLVGVIAADCLSPGKLLQHFSLGTQTKDVARPFDQRRSGTSFGEGGGFAIIANSEGLRKLGDTGAFRILGFGMSCDAKHITSPDETGETPALAVTRALKASGCDPDEIGYINAHASGTPVNDAVETTALQKAFGNSLDHTIVSGTKGAIGHLLGATGLVEVVIACWALEKSLAPGTAGLINKDESLSIPVLGQGENMEITAQIALSTTFGFGGVNSAIVVSKCT